MSYGAPSLAALATANDRLPITAITGYNTSAVIVVDTNRVYEIGSGPVAVLPVEISRLLAPGEAELPCTQQKHSSVHVELRPESDIAHEASS